MENPVINLNSIDVYNKLYGMKTQHPLVAVTDLKTVARSEIASIKISPRSETICEMRESNKSKQ